MEQSRPISAGKALRRAQIVGSTPHPHDVFMQQVVRTLMAADDGLLVEHRVLICDRDTKWSASGQSPSTWSTTIGSGIIRD